MPPGRGRPRAAAAGGCAAAVGAHGAAARGRAAPQAGGVAAGARPGGRTPQQGRMLHLPEAAFLALGPRGGAQAWGTAAAGAVGQPPPPGPGNLFQGPKAPKPCAPPPSTCWGQLLPCRVCAAEGPPVGRHPGAAAPAGEGGCAARHRRRRGRHLTPGRRARHPVFSRRAELVRLRLHSSALECPVVRAHVAGRRHRPSSCVLCLLTTCCRRTRLCVHIRMRSLSS